MARKPAVCVIEPQRSAAPSNPPRWRFLAIVYNHGVRSEIGTSEIFVVKPDWRGNPPDGPVQRAILDTFVAQLGRRGWKLKGTGRNWYEIKLENTGEVGMADQAVGHMPAATTGSSIAALNPAQFELFVAKLLTSLGFTNVVRVGKAGDLGVDVRCQDRLGRTVLTQCKRYAKTSSVGSTDIQTFIGMITVEHKADRGVFVTTSSFTTPARQLADRHGIVLIDGTMLDWLLSAKETGD